MKGWIQDTRCLQMMCNLDSIHSPKLFIDGVFNTSTYFKCVESLPAYQLTSQRSHCQMSRQPLTTAFSQNDRVQ